MQACDADTVKHGLVPYVAGESETHTLLRKYLVAGRIIQYLFCRLLRGERQVSILERYQRQNDCLYIIGEPIDYIVR